MLAPAGLCGCESQDPVFALKNMTGATVNIESYRGKVVILNFWTKTCGPCLEEMPELADLARILKDRSDVAVVTVSTDDGPDDVRDTLKTVLRGDPPFEVLFDPDSKSSEKNSERIFFRRRGSSTNAVSSEPASTAPASGAAQRSSSSSIKSATAATAQSRCAKAKR